MSKVYKSTRRRDDYVGGYVLVDSLKRELKGTKCPHLNTPHGECVVIPIYYNVYLREIFRFPKIFLNNNSIGFLVN